MISSDRTTCLAKTCLFGRSSSRSQTHSSSKLWTTRRSGITSSELCTAGSLFTRPLLWRSQDRPASAARVAAPIARAFRPALTSSAENDLPRPQYLPGVGLAALRPLGPSRTARRNDPPVGCCDHTQTSRHYHSRASPSHTSTGLYSSPLSPRKVSPRALLVPRRSEVETRLALALELMSASLLPSTAPWGRRFSLCGFKGI